MEFYREKHIEYIKALDTVGLLMNGIAIVSVLLTIV